ncbi:MAG TPA: DUF2784 domain-containing protein [Acidobacteriota bacterium]|nr:DUF2784 domain-containing protein [Acidobacteriota bacterium]
MASTPPPLPFTPLAFPVSEVRAVAAFSVLADLTVLLHLFWIIFLVFGIIFALKRSRWAWLHLGGLVFSLFINLLGMYCPLTYLENFLRESGGHTLGYGGSFMSHYLEMIIYPDLPEKTIRIGEIFFVAINLFVYGILAKRYRGIKSSSKNW